MMNKEIHFYTFYQDAAYASWCSTELAISQDIDFIPTMQMGLLDVRLITECGYRIFIHDKPCAVGKCYEIKLGQNERTNREIKEHHNLFKMWNAGEFDER